MTQTCRSNEFDTHLPVLETFNPLYANFHVADLEDCHIAVQAGGDLSRVLEGKDEAWIRMAYEVSKETETIAERFLMLTPGQKVAYPISSLSDYTLATLHDIILQGDSMDEAKRMSRRMDEIIVAILSSPSASPLLDYGWMFMDAIQYHIPDRLGLDPVEMLKQSLAYDIRCNGGRQIVEILQHMASVCVECDEPERAIEIHTAVLRYSPRRFESFFKLAMDLGKAEQYTAAIKVGSRGLGLAKGSSSKNENASDLADFMRSWSRSVLEGKSGVFSQELLGRIEGAMYASSVDAPSRDQLVRELIADIDDVPSKKPWSGETAS